MTGRPSDYSTEITTEICIRLGLGESLREICRSEDMPDKSTVMRWLAAHQEFRDQYAGAREAQADYFAEEILEIADDGTNDWMERQNGDGTTYEVENREVLNRSRLRVDTRKWLMARMAPKKYGDRLDIDQKTTHEVGESVAELMRAVDGRTRGIPGGT